VLAEWAKYFAEDTKLDHQVIVKFLSEEFSKDAHKLNRFIQHKQQDL
jgi:hypothetical protein